MFSSGDDGICKIIARYVSIQYVSNNHTLLFYLMFQIIMHT